MISNGSMRQIKVKTLYSLGIHPFVCLKWHGFHGNPLCDFKDWEYSFKNIHILAASHPRTFNQYQVILQTKHVYMIVGYAHYLI